MSQQTAVELSGFRIGQDHPVFVIAEIGLNHNGDLSLAKRLIEVAANCGANAAKFQKRDVAHLAIRSVLDAPDDRFPENGSPLLVRSCAKTAKTCMMLGRNRLSAGTIARSLPLRRDGDRSPRVVR